MNGLPELYASYPANGQTDALIDQPIALDWTTDLDASLYQNPENLNKYIVLLAEATNESVPLSYLEYIPRQRRLRLTATLTADTAYRLIIRRGIKDSNGRKSVYDYTVKFSTVKSPVSTPILQFPTDDALLQSEPYAFVWQNSTVTGVSSNPQSPGADNTPDVYYDINFYEGLSLAGSYQSNTASLLLTDQSFTSVLGSVSDKRLSWEVLAKTTISGGLVYSAPSERRVVFIGPLPELADPSSSKTYIYGDVVVPAPFGIENSEPDNYATHLGIWPTISLTFTETPITGFDAYLSVKKSQQLPRNDTTGSYLDVPVQGSWTLEDRVAYFTPSELIDYNYRVEIKASKKLPSTSGRLLGTDFITQFSTMYNPYYISIRPIKLKLRSEAATMPDDMINYFIYMASLEAKARYMQWLFQIPGAGFLGDGMLETWVRDSQNLKGFGVLKWVEACTLYNIYSSIRVDELRAVGRRRHLADYDEALEQPFLKAIEAAQEEAVQSMDQWDNFITADGKPVWASQQSLWDYHEREYDWSLTPDVMLRGLPIR